MLGASSLRYTTMPNKMRFVISGSHGFIGSALVRYLEKEGHQPVRLNRSEHIRNNRCDYGIHCAIDHANQVESIIRDSLCFYDVCNYLGCKKLLFISSGAAAKPTTDYGMAKYLTEKMLLKYSGVVVARVYALSGVGLPLDKNFALGNFVRNALNNEPIEIEGDGASIRSYLDVDDLAQWLVKIVVDGNGVYNVGSDEVISILELANLVRNISGKEMPISVKGRSDYSKYFPDITRAKELGLCVKTPLKESIKKMMMHDK